MFKNNKYVQWIISIQASMVTVDEGSTTKFKKVLDSGEYYMLLYSKDIVYSYRKL